MIVKNLPHGADDQKLRQHFSAKHPVTDVKLMKTRDGKSRRFGFVGFKNETDAEDAVKYFNDSYMGSSKILVQVAKSFSDDSLVSWKEKKRRAQEAEQLRELKRQKKIQEEQDRKKNKKKDIFGDETDENLKEYLELYGNRQANTQSWKNDDVIMDVNKVAELDEKNENFKNLQEKEDQEAKKLAQMAEAESDDEYMNLKDEKNEKNEEEDGFGDGMMSLDDWTQQKPTASEDADGDVQNEDTETTDLDWLRKHQTRIVDDTIKVPEPQQRKAKQSEIAEEEQKPSEPSKSEEEKTIEKIQKSKRLFLRNLLYSSTEDDFRDLFSKYGELEEVHLAVDTRTGKSKGFAYVQFAEGDDAVNAYETLDKQIFQGRLLHILPAEFKKENTLDEIDLKNLPLKKQNEIKRKMAAEKAKFSWNSLYMNNDAVMDSVARRLGVKKSDLLSPDNSDAAVTQALAEASVIGNVRQYFLSKGIDLMAFNNKKEHDDRVILVKNFPFNTSADEIAKLFSDFGDLKKVLMPSDGGIAMVVFKNPAQARAAFKKLAYRRFKTSILYLEKGPKGLFEDDGKEEEEKEEKGFKKEVVKDVEAKEAKVTASELLDSGNNKDEEEDTNVPTTSLFVKNLNFDTNTAKLTEVFKNLDGFQVAQVKTKANPKKPGTYLSMGFGFVEFKTKENASVALKAMEGFVLDGHKLQLKVSHRGQEGSTETLKKSKKKASTKIIIKNLPFEATKDGVQKIFSVPGGLRSVRVPRKFDKSLRGFAFAEYTTVKDAENALNTLQGTHYYGRHLVLEYAKADAVSAEDEIKEMEAKVKRQVQNVEYAGHRLSGKRKLELEGEGEDEKFE